MSWKRHTYVGPSVPAVFPLENGSEQCFILTKKLAKNCSQHRFMALFVLATSMVEEETRNGNPV